MKQTAETYLPKNLPIFRFGLRYRFSFNGKEKDDETFGDGNALDFGARIFDARLGRWMGVDPMQKMYPDNSPYNYSINSPIFLGDPDGNYVKVKTTRYIIDEDGNKVRISAIKSIFVKADIIERTIIIYNAKVIDLTGTIAPSTLTKLAETMQTEIGNNWSTCNHPKADANGYVQNSKGQQIKVTVTFANNIKVAGSVSEIKSGDNVYAFVHEDDKRVKKGGESQGGMSLLNGALSYISLTQTNDDGTMYDKTLITHETGHQGGLKDSKDPNDRNDKIMYNIEDGAATKPHPDELSKFYSSGSNPGIKKESEDLRKSK